MQIIHLLHQSTSVYHILRNSNRLALGRVDTFCTIPYIARSCICGLVYHPCLMRVEVAVLSSTAVIYVFREIHIGHLFQASNAHDAGGFNSSLVRLKAGVRNTHPPRVKNRSARDLCQIDGSSLT